jgi:hypothetical protein
MQPCGDLQDNLSCPLPMILSRHGRLPCGFVVLVCLFIESRPGMVIVLHMVTWQFSRGNQYTSDHWSYIYRELEALDSQAWNMQTFTTKP